jgi:hypothetical protein
MTEPSARDEPDASDASDVSGAPYARRVLGCPEPGETAEQLSKRVVTEILDA